ncbi:hypothetical protein [Saccharothrix sp. Mg75]|uniref:hypothetical protein n=1 Tax=Saccharothrix sp. Mg75 TaxID=3445357 RepID=UPI003EEB0989
MSGAGLVVARVLGAGAFHEVGHPTAVASSPDGELLAVAGDLGHAGSPVWDPGVRRLPLAVYRTSDLACVLLVNTRWPVGSLSFHPELPLLAAGTGQYDGGYFYEGELLLADLVTGRTRSVVESCTQVLDVAWLDARSLRVVLTPSTDDEEQVAHAFTAVRDDWGSPDLTFFPSRMSTAPLVGRPDPVRARLAVERACLDRGVVWSPRRQVRAVRALRDGRVLAALDGVAVECWDRAGGHWALPVDGHGTQVVVSPDERTALTNAVGRHDGPSAVTAVDLTTGRPLRDVPVDSHVVLVDRADGLVAARPATRGDHPGPLLAPDGRRVGEVVVGHYDLVNHYFDVRRSPHLLFLRGTSPKPWRRKWVVTPVDGGLRYLFPLEWDERRDGHLFGGPGAWLAGGGDGTGGSIVHAGTVHDGAGLLPGNAFVARRRYPKGKAEWVVTADHAPVALDADENHAYVAFASGEVVVLRNDDGAELARLRPEVAGHPVVPLSLCAAGGGRLLIGTFQGSVLDCAVTP